MPVLIDREILLNIQIDLNKKISKRLTVRFINLAILQQTPKILGIYGREILIGRIINIQYLDNGRESLRELVAADGAGREH